jgi:hypothetical protein
MMQHKSPRLVLIHIVSAIIDPAAGSNAGSTNRLFHFQSRATPVVRADVFNVFKYFMRNGKPIIKGCHHPTALRSLVIKCIELIE